MDFDEYDYLEQSVEDASRSKRTKEEEEEHRRGLRRHREDKELGDEEKERKRSRAEHKDRDRSSRREKVRDRDGERRSREREHRERDRDEEKEKEREREREKRREREREKERGRERELEKEREGRSSSRSRRSDREIEREFERSRSRDRARREREVEREIIESRRSKEKKEVVEPEADPERDQRTVFAYQMPLKATERDVYEFFSKAGKVRDVRLIMDRNSRRSKGVGYIEFYDAMSVPMAIALSGQLLLSQPVMVKPSEAEKNLAQTNTSGSTGVVGAVAARKIYVGNLPVNITEDQLRQVFEAFGQVELVQLPLDLETGHCRGYGFIQFAQVEFAKAAQTLNGKLEIAGRTIKVSSVTDHVSGSDAATNAAADLDDDEGGGLSLNARARASLMVKLDRTGTAASIAESIGVPLVLNGAVAINGQVVAPASLPALSSPLQEPIGQPSECVLLKNMFDPSTETDPEFDLDIKDEVEEECSKFGQAKHIFVDKNSKGHVYLRFDSVAAAANCQHSMHGRWYARRCISATYMRPQEYEAKFRDS